MADDYLYHWKSLLLPLVLLDTGRTRSMESGKFPKKGKCGRVWDKKLTQIFYYSTTKTGDNKFLPPTFYRWIRKRMEVTHLCWQELYLFGYVVHLFRLLHLLGSVIALLYHLDNKVKQVFLTKVNLWQIKWRQVIRTWILFTPYNSS